MPTFGGDYVTSGGAETYGCRRKASDELRLAAERFKRRAAMLVSLADALDRIEKAALSTDGGEDAAHIGPGSDAELLLWQLAQGMG